MTTAQKVIKYIAMAFAIAIIVSIASGVLKLVGLIAFVSDGEETLEDVKAYTVSSDIDSLEIDIAAAELIISTGNEFAVESNLKNLSVKEEGDCLKIKEKSNALAHYEGKAVLNIVIPKDVVLDEADITTGAGKVNIDTLSADELHLELGAGKVDIAELNAFRESSIEGGAGSVSIESGVLNDLDMDMGVGKMVLKGALTGKCDIDHGVGSVEFILTGEKDDYCIKVDKGVGSFKVDGVSVSDNSVIGSGSNEIEIDGGVGEINISFEDEEVI